MKTWLILAAVVLLFAALLVSEGVHDLHVTDEEIAAGPPEDTLGFGIYPFLAIFAVPPLLVLSWLWRRVAGSGQRRIAALVTTLFVAALGFSIWTYNLLRARVFK